MVYILACWKTDGTDRFARRTLMKWKTTEEWDFDFDDPEVWRKVLRDDWRLPTKSKGGDTIVYEVYKWGGNPPRFSFFPGYHDDGTLKKVIRYGRLK